MIWSDFGKRLASISNLTALKTLLGINPITVNNDNWSGTDLSVANGGTGVSSFTAYTPICGGTTGTGALQSVAATGSSGDVLTSNGAGALPTFQTPATGFAFTLTLVGTLTTTSGTTQSQTGIATTYKALLLVVSGVSSGSSATMRVAFSSNNGSSYGTARVFSGTVAAASTLSGYVWLYNTGNNGANKLVVPSTGFDTVAIESGVTGLIDALQVSPSAGSFDAGSIAIYGVS